MTTFQKIIKYLAMAFAVYLIVNIIGGILSLFGLFDVFLGKDSAAEKATTYTVSPDITALDIDISTADVTITQGERFSVESNLNDLNVKEKDGVLILKEDRGFSTHKGGTLKLYLPEHTVLEEADIETGAGTLTVDTLSADELTFELGAGEAEIENLQATKRAVIDGGAGSIAIHGGSLKNLDLDMGVGEINLTAALSGNNKLDLGVGESNLTLIGSKEEYDLDIEKGIGSVTIDGEDLDDYIGSTGGQNRVSIDGGVGEIHVYFSGER